MDESFDRYLTVLRQELANTSNNDIDEVLQRAHASYDQITRSDPVNMVIRGGAISGCENNNTCIMNKITIIHNNLKTMEAAGINNHFGTSCISTEYWLLKMGLKAAQ